MHSLRKVSSILARSFYGAPLTLMAFLVVAGVVPANAAAVLDISNGCAVAGPNASGTCSFAQASSTGGNPDLNWIQMSGTGTGNNFVDLSGDGRLTGGIPAGVIPFSWDFLIDSGTDGLPVAWEISFGVISGGQVLGFTTSGTTATNSEVTGSGSMLIPSALASGVWSIDLFVQSLDPTSGITFTVDVPPGSTLDINPLETTAAPEPASLLLTCTGGLLVFARNKRMAGRRGQSARRDRG